MIWEGWRVGDSATLLLWMFGLDTRYRCFDLDDIRVQRIIDDLI